MDGISDIDWDDNAFRNLVLNEDTKKLVESFVLAQLKQKGSSQFDDIVQGKGMRHSKGERYKLLYTSLRH